MPVTTRPPVPIAMGSGDTGTEEGRAFHQSRLALFGRWICLVSGTFLVFFGVLGCHRRSPSTLWACITRWAPARP
jgi:hypothetical protein